MSNPDQSLKATFVGECLQQAIDSLNRSSSAKWSVPEVAARDAGDGESQFDIGLQMTCIPCRAPAEAVAELARHLENLSKRLAWQFTRSNEQAKRLAPSSRPRPSDEAQEAG